MIKDIIGNDVRDYQQELADIISIVTELRGMKSGKRTSWKEAAEWHMKYSNINMVPELALTITLTPSGCEWASKGGCTMCGEFEGSMKNRNLSQDPQFHIAQFARSISNPVVWETAKKEGREIAWLRINQEGNFFNVNEVHEIAQLSILSLSKHIKGIKKITVECRPQYLTEQVVEKIEKVFRDSDVRLEIGMGLEAKNEIIRNICINKQESNNDFIKVVERLQRHNIDALAYIIIKPPFLTEQEAIDEAVETAHFAKDIGFSRISLEPMSIHPYTLIDVLNQTGHYSAPWLWSVVEVTKRCKDISNMVGIGGVGYYPIPSSYAHNHCNQDIDCNMRFLDCIKEYNRSRDTSVFDKLSCECKQEWIKTRVYSKSTLKERINKQLSDVRAFLPSYTPILDNTANDMRKKRIIGGGSQS